MLLRDMTCYTVVIVGSRSCDMVHINLQLPLLVEHEMTKARVSACIPMERCLVGDSTKVYVCGSLSKSIITPPPPSLKKQQEQHSAA